MSDLLGEDVYAHQWQFQCHYWSNLAQTWYTDVLHASISLLIFHINISNSFKDNPFYVTPL